MRLRRECTPHRQLFGVSQADEGERAGVEVGGWREVGENNGAYYYCEMLGSVMAQRSRTKI